MSGILVDLMAVANSPTFGLSGDEEEQNKEQQWEESEMLENIYSGEMTVLKQGVEYTVSLSTFCVPEMGNGL